MSPRIHPLSIIVFIAGVVIGVVGITLAIVFGVKNSSCPTCVTSCPSCLPTLTDCSAKLFTIRTGVDSASTGISWNDSLKDPTSDFFKNASLIISQNLTLALQQGGAPVVNSTSHSFETLAATNIVNYVVSVTKFEQGEDSMVIAYASAAVTGNSSLVNTYSDDDVISTAQTSLDNDGAIAVSPSVNSDSMGFCNAPNTNLSSTGPSPIVCSTPSDEPSTCQPTTCPTTCPPCPSPEASSCPSAAPTTCPSCPDCETTISAESTSSKQSTTTPTNPPTTSTASPIPPATCPPCQCSTFPWTTLSTLSSSSSFSTLGSTPQPGTTASSTSTLTPTTGPSTSTVVTSPGSTPLSTSLPTTVQSSPPSTSTSQGSTSIPSSTSAASSTQTSTTSATTVQSTTPYCPGGTLVYDGDIAVVFEATTTVDPALQSAQNLMMNAFISTQLMMYGTFGKQIGTYALGDQGPIDKITYSLVVPYPDTLSYGLANAFSVGPNGIIGINSTLQLTDMLMDSPDAHIADGLEFVESVNDMGKYYAVVIVGISDKFVADANVSSQNLQAKGYHVFTVVLNSTKDFSSLASDSNSAFTLPSPTIANDGIQISIAIGDFLVSKSSKCVGALTTPSPTTPASTLSPTPFTTTTADMCRQQYLTQDITYLVEDTTDVVNSNSSLGFIQILANLLQRDLKGSGALNFNSNFTVQPYPDFTPGVPCLSYCDFSLISLENLHIYLSTYGVTGAQTDPDANGLNTGLTEADQDFATYVRKNGRNETIIVFANSVNGIATATSTAKGLIGQGIAILTVAVGSNFDMSPIASPLLRPHYLNAGTDQNALAQEIATDLLQFGYICQP